MSVSTSRAFCKLVVKRCGRPAILFLAMVAVVSCAVKTPPEPEPMPEPAHLDLDMTGAALSVSSDLVRQLGPQSAGSTLAVDPFLDKATGQQTGASRRMEGVLGPALASEAGGLSVVPFDVDGIEKAGLVLTGTLTTTELPDWFVVSAALTDRRSGLVVAQSAARFLEAGLDTAPTPLYSDSPSLVRDRSVDGYVKTAETPAGSLADPLYVEQIPTAAVLAQALSAYNDGRYEEALAGYTAAAARQDGQQLRTLNGLYLSNIRLGRATAAEAAFGRIVALGLATNNLAVKLLFRPASSTEFWPDPELSGVYPMWLRQIARSVQASQTCLDVVGHTSRSGSEDLNNRLSLERAGKIRGLLQAEESRLTGRIGVSGVGYTQNVVGTGADDASDAIDRRVEFRVVSCAQ